MPSTYQPTVPSNDKMPNTGNHMSTINFTDRSTVNESLPVMSNNPTQNSFTEHRRTDSDIMALRRHAILHLPPNLELLPDESSVSNGPLPYKNGSHVVGAFIDKMSGAGKVEITGKEYMTLQILTGSEHLEERYQDVKIAPKQCCMLHKGAIVLYYRNRQPSTTNTPPFQSSHRMGTEHPTLLNATASLVEAMPSKAFSPQIAILSVSQPFSEEPRLRPFNSAVESILPTHSPEEVAILFRLQIDQAGKYSAPFDKSILRPCITAAELFIWFSHQTGCEPFQQLKFTFKDAMPSPISTQIHRGNEDHFRLMRKDIKVQCAKAKTFLPDLKEFVVLISVPGWDMPIEEEW